MLFNFPVYKRYAIWKVFLVVCAAAVFSLVLMYVAKSLIGENFNWDAYYQYLRNQSIGTVATTIFFFLSLNIFQYLFEHRRPVVSFLLPCVIGIVMVEAYNLVVDYFLPLRSNIFFKPSIKQQLTGNFLLGVTNISISLLIAYVNNLRDVRKKHRLLQEQKLKLEVEKMEADLKFLKSQINPHFLHNTLNSFYARALPLSKELADGILTLSEMMRYALGESYTDDGKVLLKAEVDHLRNFIKMNQFRFRNNLNVQLQVHGVLNGAVIIPFVLITLVENIMKHGDLSDPQEPIVISIEIKNGRLEYYSRNKKNNGPRELSTGIGLDNIQQRLQLAYGNGFDLSIKDEAQFYSTSLIIHKL